MSAVMPESQSKTPGTGVPWGTALLIAATGILTFVVLIELVNTDVKGGVDLSDALPRARDLAADNRVYRRTAAQAGQPVIADLLEDLERVLLELANGPESMNAAEFAELRRRIEGRGLLIKVRFVGQEVRERARRPTQRPGANEI